MKIMTLNIWNGRLKDVTTNHLKALDLDFACMQEVAQIEGKTLGLAVSSDVIAKALGAEHQYFSPSIDTELGGKKLSFGNAIYSRFLFAQQYTEYTYGQYNENYDLDEDDYNMRAFQHVVVEVGGKKLNLINHHGYHVPEHKNGNEETNRQAQQIIDFIDGLEGPVIFCCDLNLSPESNAVQMLNKKLRNLSVEYKLATTRPVISPKSEVCDYIFVNDLVKVNDFTMDETIISDHYGLLLDFDLA